MNGKASSGETASDKKNGDGSLNEKTSGDKPPQRCDEVTPYSHRARPETFVSPSTALRTGPSSCGQKNRTARAKNGKHPRKILGPVRNLEEHVPPDWWRFIFNSLYLKTDSDVVDDDRITATEIALFADILKLAPDDKILDLCCGQGRHLLELTRRGYDVLGFDISAYMLKRLGEIAGREGIQPKLVQGNMRDLSFDSEFDAVINMRTSFGYLETEDEDQKVLDGVCRALEPGGRFLMDLINRDSLMRRYREQFWVRTSRGDIVIADSTFDVRTGRNIVREIAFHADGRRSETNHDIRMYTCHELEDKLTRAGMRIESVWGDWDSSPFDLDHRHMLIVALKGEMGNG